MKRSIRRLASGILIGFFLIAALLLYWQVLAASNLTADPAHNRTRLLQEKDRTQRGRISDRNGVVLAESVRGVDGWKRTYSQPALVHVVGYHSPRFGNSAIEDRFDDYLAGRAGLNPLRALGDRLLHRPAIGTDVTLTIDSRLQKVVDDSLGTATGAVVALNPRTGEVLALASHPFFDPNRMEDEWDRLRQDQAKPFLDRATQGLYPPGSTFKTITLAAALEQGVTRPEEVFTYDLKVDGQGQYYHDIFVQGFRIVDANHGPTEDHRSALDLAHSYAMSDNVTFAEIGLRLGARRLIEAASRFGLGSPIPIEVPASISRIGPDNAISKGDPTLAATAFGQGELSVTPLQMALVAAAVANDGIVPKPYVVQRASGQDGEVLHTTPEQWRRAMPSDIAKTVGEMMVISARDGWARTAQIPGAIVAAKTGTAETGMSKGTHAWFIAYAPAENPIIAVAVIKEFAGGGSTQAGPVAKAVMEAALHPR